VCWAAPGEIVLADTNLREMVEKRLPKPRDEAAVGVEAEHPDDTGADAAGQRRQDQP
jgi:hypothetical protein